MNASDEDRVALIRLKREEASEKRKVRLRDMSIDDLLISLMQLCVARGRAAEKLATTKKRDKAGRKRHFLNWKTLSERSEEVLSVASERLGGGIGELNRRMNWRTMVARERHHRECDRCGSKGGVQGRHLDFYNGDGPGLTRIVRSLAIPSDEAIKEAICTWTVLCKRCREEAIK